MSSSLLAPFSLKFHSLEDNKQESDSNREAIFKKLLIVSLLLSSSKDKQRNSVSKVEKFRYPLPLYKREK